MDDDFAKAGALRGNLFPKPRRHVFDRRIFQAGDLIQIRMVELRDKRFHRRADPRVIVNPAARAIDFAFDRNFHFEAVPVHPAALVTLGRGRQSLRGFKGKIFR